MISTAAWGMSSRLNGGDGPKVLNTPNLGSSHFHFLSNPFADFAPSDLKIVFGLNAEEDAFTNPEVAGQLEVGLGGYRFPADF